MQQNNGTRLRVIWFQQLLVHNFVRQGQSSGGHVQTVCLCWICKSETEAIPRLTPQPDPQPKAL